MNSAAPTPTWHEENRLQALRSYDILDSAEEKVYNDAVLLASQICGTPISLVSFVESERQWFKAKVGTDLKETPTAVSICQHALFAPGLFVVPDTTQDERFKDNPLVQGEPHIRFYAGAVLETPEGLPLGTICVLDDKPRQLTKDQILMLQTLARMLMTQLELRRAVQEQKRAEASLRSVLAAVPDCVKILDLDGRLEWLNENGKQEMEVDDFSSLHKTVWTELWPEAVGQEAALAAVATARLGGISRFCGFCPTLAGPPNGGM